jgi:hypothetical protein
VRTICLRMCSRRQLLWGSSGVLLAAAGARGIVTASRDEVKRGG